MKRLLAGILLAFALSSIDSLAAQCTTVYGACNGSVSGIACNTAPRVGSGMVHATNEVAPPVPSLSPSRYQGKGPETLAFASLQSVPSGVPPRRVNIALESA